MTVSDLRERLIEELVVSWSVVSSEPQDKAVATLMVDRLIRAVQSVTRQECVLIVQQHGQLESILTALNERDGEDG